MRRGGALVAACLLVCLSASAQPNAADKAAADVLFSDAEKLMDAGQYASACPKYSESQRLDPQLGTLLHLADCFEKNGQTASAWASFREAAELADKRNDPREGVAKERAAALETRLVRLAIVVPPASDVPGLEIARGAQPIGRALWGVETPVDPGKIEITAKAPSRIPWSTHVDVTQPGSVQRVSIPLLAPEAPVAAPPVPAPVVATKPAEQAPPAAESSSSPLKTFGFIAAGFGVASMIGGGILAIVASNAFDKANSFCPTGTGCTASDVVNYDTFYKDGEQWANGSRIAFAVGGTLLVGGIVMVVLAPSSKSTARAPVGFVATRDGGQLTWTARW